MPEDDDLFEVADETRIGQTLLQETTVSAGPSGDIKVDPLPKIIRPRVEVSSGRGKGKSWTIEKPMVIIGRISDVADVVVPDPAASRHHAAIAHQDGRFVLYDMGSTNGTLVDGQAVKRVNLDNGTSFEIGDTTLTFWLD